MLTCGRVSRPQEIYGAPLGSRLELSNVSLEIAQSPSRWFNHPMRRTVLSTFLFTAILGLGCVGVAVPGQAEELKHPIELGKECKVLFQEYYDRSRSDDGPVVGEDSSSNFHFYNAFAYAYGATGKYACGYDVSPRPALERCNSMSSHSPGGEASFPPAQQAKTWAAVEFTQNPR